MSRKGLALAGDVVDENQSDVRKFLAEELLGHVRIERNNGCGRRQRKNFVLIVTVGLAGCGWIGLSKGLLVALFDMDEGWGPRPKAGGDGMRSLVA